MTKKDTLSLLIILCLTSLLLSAAYFLTPHAVVRSPEHTQLSVIHMDSPNGSGTSYSWVPTTEEDQAIAQKIVEYLSSAQERYTFQRTLYGGYPADWDVMTLMLSMPDGSTRGIVLGPAGFQSYHDKDAFVNYSYPSSPHPSFPNALICTLIHPEEIQAFVDEAFASS